MSSDQRRVDVGTDSIEFQVARSAEATEPRIDVSIHEIQVVIPEASDTDPETLLVENSRWVLEKKRKYDDYREMAPERSFEPGETFLYLGEERKLVVEPRPENTVADDTIRLRQSAVSRSSVKRVLRNFYRTRAREHLTECAVHYAAEMGVEYDQLQLRNQRTRWGSCSTNGTLSFNWRLSMAPPKVIDYVTVHELAHLREPNHTQTFWSLVADHGPEYQAHANWLEEHSAQLIFSDEDL
ncbi:metal-dependent hydrolase [Halobacteriales archaeon QS_4_69_34]|nr:MAG: metal-dependent hydrolase [Halobacteriales archaeon QS_4_69_34]